MHFLLVVRSVPTYYVPEAIRPHLEQARDAMTALDCAGGDREGLLHMNLVGVQPGDEVELPIRGIKLFVRVFGVQHAACPAVGYVIGSRRAPALKEEYRGLDWQEIRDLLAQGVSIKTEATEVLEVAYTGDTSVEGLLVGKESIAEGDEREAKSALYVQQAFQSGLLLCEATFLEDSEKSKNLSKQRGHLTIHDISRALAAHKFVKTDQQLVLLHISGRYSASQAMSEIAAVLPTEMFDRCRVAIRSHLTKNHEEKSWTHFVKDNGCILLSDYAARRQGASAAKKKPIKAPEETEKTRGKQK